MKNNPTPELICKTFVALLADHDYNTLSMNDIASAAFIGRRTCYRYFSNKEEIIRAVVDGIGKGLTDEILKAQKMSDKADPLRMVTIFYFRFWEKNLDLIRNFKKARILHYISDEFENIILKVAMDIKYNGTELTDEMLAEVFRSQKYYEFIFKLSGFWRVTVEWCSEEDRRSAEEMSEMVCSFF